MARPLKTYSHLAGARRVPSEYEIATTRLLYQPQRGFEVDVPLADWYRRHQQGSALRCADWEAFADPRATTYTAYTALQSRQEAHAEGLLRSIDERDYDAALPAPARELVVRLLSPLRFAVHGLQMVAAYVGQLAPASRIAIAAMLQAADELRRLQRIAYRVAQLRRADARLEDADARGRALWQRDPAWQPLRRLIERLLVTWDWGEALVALNVCTKPLLDEAVLVGFAAAARQAGDYLLGELFFSLKGDCLWHAAWTEALLATAVRQRPENDEVIAGWRQAWAPVAEAAVAALPAAGTSADSPAAAATDAGGAEMKDGRP